MMGRHGITGILKTILVLLFFLFPAIMIIIYLRLGPVVGNLIEKHGEFKVATTAAIIPLILFFLFFLYRIIKLNLGGQEEQ